MTSVELWLLEKLISEAESPDTKKWVLSKMKECEAAVKNPYLKIVLQALETALAA